MSDTPPPLRVGDRERRAVDEQLQAAVGDGVLTLSEYDERSAVLWQARTRDELDELVADLRRLEREFRRTEQDSDVSYRTARLQAISLAYDDTLLLCCRLLDVPEP